MPRVTCETCGRMLRSQVLETGAGERVDVAGCPNPACRHAWSADGRAWIVDHDRPWPRQLVLVTSPPPTHPTT